MSQNKIIQDAVKASRQLKNEIRGVCSVDLIARPDFDLLDLVPDFIANRKSDVIAMRAALASGDLGRVRYINHDIRGVAKSFGFLGLDTLSAKLSDCHGKPVEMSATVDEIEFYIHNVNVISAT